MSLFWKKPKEQPSQELQQFAIVTPIERAMYYDPSLCEAVLRWTWDDVLLSQGGVMVEEPEIAASRFVITRDDGREHECAENEGWDLVWMRVVGFALPPADSGS
jgi:hypothetical protein